MNAKASTVLGISLGTRSTGIALLEGNELLDWKVQSFKGSWSINKLRLIQGAINAHIRRHKPTVIILKIPPKPYASKRVAQLARALEKLGLRKGIEVRFCILMDLKRLLASGAATSIIKEMLIESVTAKFPELQHEYRKEKRNRNAYYSKVFEAVGCTLLCPPD